MNNTAKQLLAALLLLSFVITSCGAGNINSKAEEIAKAYYAQLQKKDYDSALLFCSNRAFDKSTKAEWRKALETNAGLLGDIKSFTKTSGFNIATSTSNGTTVSVTYNVEWQYGKSTDSVLLVKEKDGSMKIYRYTWKYKDAKFLAEIIESEKLAAAYMKAVTSGDYNGATAFCSDEALKITPKEKWTGFLSKMTEKYGTINSFNVLSDSSYYNIAANGDAGVGNYYDIFIQSDRGGNKMMEKIVFFQKNYDEPVKLAGHYPL